MRRRTCLAVLVGSAFACPPAVRAQQAGKTYRVGYIFLGAQPPDPRMSPPWPSLRELGYAEGTNLVVERRFASGRRDRLARFASELVALKPDVILAQGGQSAVAASSATREIPIVVMGAGDPVGTGLVRSLAHPGGNVTGVAELSTVLSAKRLELLIEAVPGVSRVAVLWNAADPAMALRYREIESAAKTMHIEIRPLAVRDPEDFDDAFAGMRHDRPDAMFMITDALTGLNRKRIVQFAAENRLPAIYEVRDPVDDGGLMSYGPILPDVFARAAYYIDRILQGTKPEDLPIEQPTKVELVVNLKTAKLLNIELPPTLLARADEVIE